MTKEKWMWLAAGLGYGAVNTTDLLMAYPEGVTSIEADLGGYQMDELLTQKQAEKLASSRPEDFALRLAHYEAAGIHVLPIDDPLYPAMLRSIENPPLVLYVKGEVGLLNGQLAIGMVGARRPSAYGVEAVRAIGKGVALGGAIIVSGLAAGLDAEAHKAALSVNGPTIACIAFGHDHCYPAANRKLMEVIEKHGAVISEYPLGTQPEKPFFLQRNRIIAGFSHGLIVGEARKRSGTMSTVNFAIDYGRDIFAIPGSIFSELSGGTNDMIRDGAYLAGSATDVLGVYGIELKEEDPVIAAAKQAAEGRPLAAAKEPAPWQQSLVRHQKAQEEQLQEKETPLISSGDVWQKTLAEALHGELQKTDLKPGAVNSKQAIQAFQKLQENIPGGQKSITFEDAGLEEMAASVNDSVSFSQSKKETVREKDEPKVKPFQWDKVEHIRKQETAVSKKETVVPPSSQPLSQTAVKQVAAMETPVAPVYYDAVPVQENTSKPLVSQPVSPQGVAEFKRQMEQETPYAPPTGLRTSPNSQTSQGVSQEEAELSKAFVASLSQRLRTMHSAEEPKAEKVAYSYTYTEIEEKASPVPVQSVQQTIVKEAYSETMDMDEQEAAYDDPLLRLSDAALRAYSQLLPTPVTLDEICTQSGLSLGEAMAALTELELSGLSRQLAGRQFVIMQ